MESLHPSLWRSCRVLANEKRLRLLWELFRNGESNVSRLGAAVGLTEPVASSYLRAINSRGIILSKRKSNYVFYRAEANPEVDGASELLQGLKDAYTDYMSIEHAMKLLTAFTHERRIVIMKLLTVGEMEESELSIKAGISPQALYRHLRKLEARGYVERNKGRVSSCMPKGALAEPLLKLAIRD